MLFHFISKLKLSFLALRTPIQIGNLIERAKFFFWIAVTFQAEPHAKGFFMADFVHFVHLAVAFETTDAAVHVNRVIEIYIVGYFMYLHPGN